MGIRAWAERLDERVIERGAEQRHAGLIPPLRYRAAGALVGAAIGFLLLYGLDVPLFYVLASLALLPALLAMLWRRGRRTGSPPQ